MNCPHCQEELPANYFGEWCPVCGKELLPRKTDTQLKPIFEPRYVNWPMFFIVLFAPSVCCFLGMIIGSGGLVILPALLGGVICGLVCTRMIMEGLNHTGFRRAMVNFGLAILLCGLSYSLCYIGCVSAESFGATGI